MFTAFSGSHQDAIKKGFAGQQAEALWEVPYLPVDPADVGRSYDSIIRVNSQSGKGGIAYLMENGHGIVMPRRMQVEFSGIVQRHTDEHGGEVSAAELWQIFSRHYLEAAAPLRYVEHHLFEHGEAQGIRITVEMEGVTRILSGEGNGPIDAAVHALRMAGVAVEVGSYEERSMGHGGDAQACAFVEVAIPGQSGECHGAGADANIVTASIKALISGANRLAVRSALPQAA